MAAPFDRRSSMGRRGADAANVARSAGAGQVAEPVEGAVGDGGEVGPGPSSCPASGVKPTWETALPSRMIAIRNWTVRLSEISTSRSQTVSSAVLRERLHQRLSTTVPRLACAAAADAVADLARRTAAPAVSGIVATVWVRPKVSTFCVAGKRKVRVRVCLHALAANWRVVAAGGGEVGPGPLRVGADPRAAAPVTGGRSTAASMPGRLADGEGRDSAAPWAVRRTRRRRGCRTAALTAAASPAAAVLASATGAPVERTPWSYRELAGAGEAHADPARAACPSCAASAPWRRRRPGRPRSRGQQLDAGVEAVGVPPAGRSSKAACGRVLVGRAARRTRTAVGALLGAPCVRVGARLLALARAGLLATSAVPVNDRTSAPAPAGSAKRVCWQASPARRRRCCRGLALAPA